MMPRFPAGTPHPLPKRAHLTTQQWDALEDMKDPAYTVGVARAEFANTLLLPDGSRSTDLAAVSRAVQERYDTIANGADMADPDTLAALSESARLVQTVRHHVALSRYLFIVDQDGMPVVYFQCGTPDNEDVHAYLKPAEAAAPTPAPE